MSANEPPLQSKKFMAFLISEVAWKVALLVLLILGMNNNTIDVLVGAIALAIVIIAGFVECLYIGGQAALDKYTRVAEIAAGAGHNIEMKGITMGTRKEAPPEKEAAPTPDKPKTKPKAG